MDDLTDFKMDIESRKDIERLRWEYLKRSDEFVKNWLRAIKCFNARRQNSSYNRSDDDRASFKSFRHACGNMRLVTYFSLYGPDQVSFDDFWEEIEKDSRIAIAENYIKDNPIMDYRLRIKEDFDYLINTLISPS